MENGKITRADYQMNRLNILSQLVSLDRTEGLEIGAGDLPTIRPGTSICFHANFRPREELILMAEVTNPDDVPKVDYLIDRQYPLSRQIADRKFDYIVMAHVLEHVPDPIGYLQDLVNILNNMGVILITLPDKRRTFDQKREITPIDHILNDYYEKAKYPSIEHIMDFGRSMIDEFKDKSPIEIYKWAVTFFESGIADAHCHVWSDEYFFQQMDYIISGNLVPGVSIVMKWPNRGEFNEFMIALQYVK